jgi:hypothetical protein
MEARTVSARMSLFILIDVITVLTVTAKATVGAIVDPGLKFYKDGSESDSLDCDTDDQTRPILRYAARANWRAKICAADADVFSIPTRSMFRGWGCETMPPVPKETSRKPSEKTSVKKASPTPRSLCGNAKAFGRTPNRVSSNCMLTRVWASCWDRGRSAYRGWS